MVFYVKPIADGYTDIGSLKFLHALFDTNLYHMLLKSEQNRMVRTTHYFELFDKKKMVIYFDKELTPFLKTFLLKQLFDARLLIWRLSSFSVSKIAV